MIIYLITFFEFISVSPSKQCNNECILLYQSSKQTCLTHSEYQPTKQVFVSEFDWQYLDSVLINSDSILIDTVYTNKCGFIIK